MVRARAATRLITGVAWLVLACPGPATASAWRVLPTPNPAGATRSQLVGVTCPSRGLCLAVGYSSPRPGAYTPLVERWSHGGWSLQRVPQPSGAQVGVLDSVSCATPNACTAAGYGTAGVGVATPLAERWNGSRWSVTRPPLPAGAASAYLASISCPTSRLCVAAGSYYDPTGNQLALAERWDGRVWSIEPVPAPTDGAASRFTGVSCPSPTICTGVGTFLDGKGDTLTLAERWDGSSWSIQPSPDPSLGDSELTGISCTSPDGCTAVGFFAPGTGGLHTLAEHWDGTTWVAQPTPNRRGRTNQLFGVACASGPDCTAVGNFADRGRAFATLGERGRRGSWAIQRTPHPAGSSNSGLDAVSCSGGGSCTAVGYAIESSGRVVTLAERMG